MGWRRALRVEPSSLVVIELVLQDKQDMKAQFCNKHMLTLQNATSLLHMVLHRGRAGMIPTQREGSQVTLPIR